jgi:hypothetical protein
LKLDGFIFYLDKNDDNLFFNSNPTASMV